VRKLVRRKRKKSLVDCGKLDSQRGENWSREKGKNP
jgi:hypothetical protein